MNAGLPNIVLFTWHDAGDWFGCYGHGTVKTPGVDRLAAEGARFSNHFSACAICSPSRAAMLTGRYCQANGVMGLTNTVYDNRILPGNVHLSRRLREAGWQTTLMGVQHECAHEHVHDVIAPHEQWLTDPWPSADTSRKVLREWLRKRNPAEGPFFLQLGSFEAHLGRFFKNLPSSHGEPYPPILRNTEGLAMPEFLAGSEADLACVAALQGLLHRGDGLMQELLEGLDACGLANDTLVIMAVDHGVGLARCKAHCYEQSLKTAWILRWPGHISGSVVLPDLATHVDLTPTVLGLVGLPVKDGFDGVDFSGRLTGSDPNGPKRDAVFGHMTESARTIRCGRFRLVRHFRPPQWAGRKGDCAALHSGYPSPNPRTEDGLDAHLELFDCELDPANLRDLSREPGHAETLRDLDSKLWRFLQDQNDFILHENAHSQWQLKTRKDFEDFLHGSLRR